MRKKLHEVQIKAVQLMDKIGSANGTTSPESQDPLDAALHEMALSKTLSSVADKRYEAAKAHVLRSVEQSAMDDVTRLEANVLKSSTSMRKHVASGQFYDLNVEIRLAGSKFDEKKLRVLLLTEHKLSTEQIDKLWSDCKVVNAPRRYYEVTDRGEE